jgi:hypothetical protein
MATPSPRFRALFFTLYEGPPRQGPGTGPGGLLRAATPGRLPGLTDAVWSSALPRYARSTPAKPR